MMRNNKGFSLIELLVALAILAVAGIAITGFVMNTSNSYAQTNKEVKLQYEQQLAVNQIRDMIVESDRGIYFDATSKTLALYGAAREDGGAQYYPVTVIHFKETEGKLYYATKEFDSVSEITFAFIDEPNVLKLLSDNVTKFEVDLSGVPKDKVQIQITFKVGDKEQTVTENIALRNRLVVSNMVDTIWGEEIVTVNSFIKGISIRRGTTVFANGAHDSIGKSGDKVVVSYSAIVTTTEESNKEYTVKWTLEDAPAGVRLLSDGRVEVTRDAPVSESFKLYATSTDDATKSCYIVIKIEDTGVYAVKAELECSGPIVGNGYHNYMLVPTLYYTDERAVSDYSLFTWQIEVTWQAEDDGKPSTQKYYTFDEETGVLTLTSNANGGIFKIKAKAVERDANGDVIFSNEVMIEAKDIPEYVVGPSVSIAVASSLPRGGYIFPTMVFKNASSSTYTYNWKVEPYWDSETARWDSDLTYSEFNLISLSESGGYNGNVKHEMQTGADKRSIALNCAEWLNWNSTFKVIVSGTATDEEGNVLVATPKVVTIYPVEVTIAPTDSETVNWDKYTDENRIQREKPILTSSVLRYEDWYWDGYEKGTKAAKYSPTRRWFTLDCSNLYMTGFNLQGCNVRPNYLFQNQVKTLLSNDYVGNPHSDFASTKMMYGFRKYNMFEWEDLADRPVYMNFSVTVYDNYGNEKTSNVQYFTIEYDFYDPTEE